MHIVLTNDDGIQAPGLRALYHGLLDAGHRVTVIAPVTEQSAVGHAITFVIPLRVKIFDEQNFKGLGVHGTPVDCMKLGLTSLVADKPDLILSGINAARAVAASLLARITRMTSSILATAIARPISRWPRSRALESR